MQLGGNPIKVKLTSDLTKYDERCKVEQEGKTIPDTKLSMWGDADRFVAVQFDNGARMDVLWSSLEEIK